MAALGPEFEDRYKDRRFHTGFIHGGTIAFARALPTQGLESCLLLLPYVVTDRRWVMSCQYRSVC